MSTKKWFFSIAMLTALLIFAGCAKSPDSNQTDENQNANSPNDSNALIIGAAIEATTLDPAGSNDVPSEKVYSNIYETLTQRDDENNIIPGLAEDWKFLDDRTLELYLKKDITFHDGEAFNADVVKMNLDRLLDPEVASPKLSTFNMIEEVTVVDDSTVQIKTEFPFTPILVHLSHSGANMISPKSIEADYAAMKEGKQVGSVISANPVGTGFFKFESWEPDQQIVLTKNEDYYGKQAAFDQLIFKVIPEVGTRNADLERGFIHVAETIQSTQVESLNATDYAHADVTPSTALTFIGFNTEKAPFDNVKVRQAVTMLIDKQEIIDGVYEGYADPAIGPLAPLSFGYSDNLKPIEHNVEEAKKLLAEAGLADGFDITFWTNDDDQRKDTAVIIQSVLKDAGINMTIETMEFGAYLDELRAGKHDMFMLSWGNSLADADNGLYNLFHSSGKGSPPNAMNYGNERVDQLLTEGRTAQTPEERLAIYEELQQILIDDAPMIYLNHPHYLTGVSNQLDGFKKSTADWYKLQNASFK